MFSWAILPACNVASKAVNTSLCMCPFFADSTEAQAHYSTTADLRSDQELMSSVTFYAHNITHGSS